MSNDENPYAPSLGESLLPEEQYNSGQLATRVERFAGSLIDGIIGLAVGFPMGIVLGIGVGAVLGEGLVPNLVVQVLGGLVGIGLFLAIQGYFLATRSQTIGKIALGTKIVRDNGETLPFGELYTKRYLILQLLSIVPFIGGFVGLINALFIFRSNRKCLHDDLAGTKVIKLR